MTQMNAIHYHVIHGALTQSKYKNDSIKVQAVIADHVEDHLSGFGQCHMTQMNAIQCHVIHSSLTQSMNKMIQF
jgi:hypothetical protein